MSEYDYNDAYGALQVFKDPAGVVERYGFDGFGRLAWHDEASGRQTQYTYAAEGPGCSLRSLWVTEQSGTGAFPGSPVGDGHGWQSNAARWFSVIYDEESSATSVSVADATGRVIARHEGGAILRYTYGGFGSLVQVSMDGHPEQTRSMNTDAWGRLLRVDDADAGSHDLT